MMTLESCIILWLDLWCPNPFPWFLTYMHGSNTLVGWSWSLTPASIHHSIVWVNHGCVCTVTKGYGQLVYAPEKAVAPHSSTLAWKIPWMEEPGRLQSMGSLQVGHDWATSLSFFPFMHWRRKWQPTAVFSPGESQGRGSLWAAVYGVAQSRTRLKWLSSSSSSSTVVWTFFDIVFLWWKLTFFSCVDLSFPNLPTYSVYA